MDFYLSMILKNPQRTVEQQSAVVQDSAQTAVALDNQSNFLNYQFDQKDGKQEAKPIPPRQQPAPKKLKDAISKRTDSPARRYMDMVNR